MLNQYGDSPNETVAPHQITHSPNPNPRLRRISMADIPDDVLVPIFRQVFNCTGQRKPKTGIHFPESVASVCAQWRAVMFSVSEFWSVLLIATDPDSDKPTPLSVVSRYLELSKDRPLDINICTHDKAEWHRGIPIEQVYSLQATKLSMLHVHEKARVAAAMALLTPHQGRWHRLYVDVVFSTSLPRPHIDFYGTLPHLRHLVFKCYYSRGQVENVTPTTGTLEAPILESMDIYGGALCQILERGTPMLPKLNEIIIDASFHNGKYTFSLVDFVKLLPKLPLLRTLRCDSVELASSGDELPHPTSEVLHRSKKWNLHT